MNNLSRDERADTIKRAELKLLHTVAFIFGLIYLVIILTKTDDTWYGWLSLTVFACFCLVIVFRFVSDLKDGTI